MNFILKCPSIQVKSLRSVWHLGSICLVLGSHFFPGNMKKGRVHHTGNISYISKFLTNDNYSVIVFGDQMFEFISNIPASINVFTSLIKPQTEFLFSISSEDGEGNPFKNIASIQEKQHPLITFYVIIKFCIFLHP